jgi:hypothetical protein
VRTFLRFVFPEADQAHVAPASIQATDAPYSAAPSSGTPYPQALQLAFTVTGPAPQVVPLFPGEVTFIPDPAAPGTIPEPDDAVQSSYASWKTRGTIKVSLVDKALMQEFLTLMSQVGPIPTTLWYGPVVITEDFLFVTLATGLKKKTVVSGATKVEPSNASWSKHAIARFLQGRYTPELRLGATANDDDVARFPMPRVVLGAGAASTLTLTVARTQKAQDVSDAMFDLNSGVSMPRTDPVHQSHGAIPARHVYRLLRWDTLGAALGEPVPDKILAEWPSAPRYYPIQFTRTWKRIPNCSAYLSRTTAVVTSAGGTVLVRQRLPAHGWLFVAQAPVTPDPPPAQVLVSVADPDDMRIIDGATPDVWRQKAGTAPIAYTLGVTQPHVVARRRMSAEIFADFSRPTTPQANACTYFSLRRTIRALVDHRVTGGRLVHEEATTKAETKRLLDDAFSGTPATSAILLNGNPKPSAAPPTSSPKLGKIWEAFFPDPAPAQNVGGSFDRTTILTQGQMAYLLWQVAKEEFEEGTKRNFADAHVARGSAGALVSVNLATGFSLDPAQNPGETDAAYFDRIVELMLTTLERGSLLQFWEQKAGFEALKARNLAGLQGFGHSPTFSHVMDIDPATGKPAGIVVIDQTGNSPCPIVGAPGNRRLTWLNKPIQIWCAAAWDE